MYSITKSGPNRVDIEFSGGIDANMMTAILDELITKSEDLDHGGMLYVIKDFEMPTLGALAVELSKLPSLLGLISKFDKCAVVSDAGWIRAAADIEGVLIPGLTIKTFLPEEKAAAELWLDS